MANRRSISPRQFAESMYVPEENTAFQTLRNDPEYYNKLIDAGLMASMVIPPLGGYGAAFNLARGAREAAPAASEVAAAMRALPAPRRNAMYPEEMLAPEVISLPYRRPSTEYRAIDIRPTGERFGPPTRLQMEARESARHPVVDQMYSPTGRNEFGGTVRGTVDPIAALETEALVPVSNAEKWANVRQKEAQRVQDMISEGGVWPTQQRNLRRIEGEAEDAFRARQLATMEGEGGGAGRQAAINEMNRAIEENFRNRQLGIWGDEAGAITSGRNPPQPVSRALDVVHGRPASSNPNAGFIMVDTPGSGFTMVNPASRAVAMRTIGSEAAGPAAASREWATSSNIPVMSFTDRALRTATAGSPLILATAFTPTQNPAASYSIPPNYDADSGEFTLSPPSVGSGRGSGDYRPNLEEMIKAQAENEALDRRLATQIARERMAPLPPKRPEESSILGRIFSGKDYQSAGGETLTRPSGGPARLNWGDPESAADFVRAAQAEKALRAAGEEYTGMKRGGAAEKKPDAIHKALEIIHHLISTR